MERGPDLRERGRMAAPSFLRRNGLSLTLLAIFLVCMAGQTFCGWYAYNEEQREHNEPPVELGSYLTSGHFLEATAENWESEFLQMAGYVLLTIGLVQKGSSESKSLSGKEAVDRDPRLSRNKQGAPAPVRRGGIWLTLYSHSLSIAFGTFFLASFALHGVGGAKLFNEEAVAHGQPTIGIWEYIQSSTFWFESFQNWQSEFLALLAMVFLSIYLRRKGSPESKPVDAPHSETGSG
jgi:hypothetical protein